MLSLQHHDRAVVLSGRDTNGKRKVRCYRPRINDLGNHFLDLTRPKSEIVDKGYTFQENIARWMEICWMARVALCERECTSRSVALLLRWKG